ncbi:MAG: hypothetical protein J7L62_06985 [Candidatus Aminicenantes bacterium]|nr:hypothetical protein [Candidatus Aminicenantes bacterium]
MRIEEIEVYEWDSLDAIKEKAEVIEEVGNLDLFSSMSVFCTIGEDYFELIYSDTEGNYIRHFPDEDLFYRALRKRREEFGVLDRREGSDLEDFFE